MENKEVAANNLFLQLPLWVRSRLELLVMEGNPKLHKEDKQAIAKAILLLQGTKV